MSAKDDFSLVLRKNKLNISNEQVELLAKYVELLKEWNERLNLVSRRDIEKIWVRHILASVSILFRFSLETPSSILDLGTGGGLPGIPLAIVYPEAEFVLVDSIRKKISAVKDMTIKLQLSNTKAICARAEDLAKEKQYATAFDYVVSRGVASAADIVKWGRDFLHAGAPLAATPKINPDGRRSVAPPAIILIKGGDLDEEIARAKTKANPQSIEIDPIVITGITGAETDDLFDKKSIIIRP